MENTNEQRRSTPPTPAAPSKSETEDSPRLAYALAAYKRALKSQSVVQLQRQIGNRATAAILANPAVQRDIDLSGIENSRLLFDALLEYQDAEQQELNSEEAEAWPDYTPLFQMFGGAQDTTLKLSTGSYKQVDFATTELFAFVNGKPLNHDGSQSKAFAEAVIDKRVERFVVRVIFNRGLVDKEDNEHGSLKKKGVILQALTHELTIHAENMLRFTQQYWVMSAAANRPTRSAQPATSILSLLRDKTSVTNSSASA